MYSVGMKTDFEQCNNLFSSISLLEPVLHTNRWELVRAGIHSVAHISERIKCFLRGSCGNHGPRTYLIDIACYTIPSSGQGKGGGE